ncbi:MAG: hypothetical protein HY334_00325 [Armatimonadetes bacterium]|nr:hypothetical protein [Armatimonadota bacterium]
MSTRAARALQEAIYHSVVGLFYVAPRLLYALAVDGASRFRHHPSTLVVVNHKRDLDSVLVPPTLLYNGVRPKRPMWFAGREDMFLRGFLATYDVVPAWLRRLLHEMDLTSVLAALRILPVRRFRERTMDEALREAVATLGDLTIDDTLSPAEAAFWHLPDAPPLRLADLLGWRFYERRRRSATMRAFAPPWRDRLRRRQDDVVARQMQALAGVLNRGDVLYLAPEGVISPDGRLQAFRSGLRQILSIAEVQVRLQPACIVYDFMRPGRLGVHLAVGNEMKAPASPAAGEANVRRAIAALHTMTVSQVASQVVWDLITAGREAIDPERLITDTQALAAGLRGAGLRTDGALLGMDGAERIEDWVRFVERGGWVIRRGGELRIDAARLRRAPATYWQNPVRYCVNEVQSVRAALDGAADRAAASS